MATRSSSPLASDLSVGLQRVSAAGGTPIRLTKADPTRTDGSVVGYPSFMPDGRRVLVSTIGGGQSASSTAVLDLQTLELRVVLPGGAYARYVSPGALVFSDGGTIRAVSFDADGAEVIGNPL